jgi:C4-type Zn-finger protein
MPARKECPLCGEAMRLRENRQVVRIPGNPQASTRVSSEWVCPECDYFEEAEGEEA